MRPVSHQDAEAVRRLRANGVSIREIARALRIDSKTVQKILRK